MDIIKHVFYRFTRPFSFDGHLYPTHYHYWVHELVPHSYEKWCEDALSGKYTQSFTHDLHKLPRVIADTIQSYYIPTSAYIRPYTQFSSDVNTSYLPFENKSMYDEKILVAIIKAIKQRIQDILYDFHHTPLPEHESYYIRHGMALLSHICGINLDYENKTQPSYEDVIRINKEVNACDLDVSLLETKVTVPETYIDMCQSIGNIYHITWDIKSIQFFYNLQSSIQNSIVPTYTSEFNLFTDLYQNKSYFNIPISPLLILFMCKIYQKRTLGFKDVISQTDIEYWLYTMGFVVDVDKDVLSERVLHMKGKDWKELEPEHIIFDVGATETFFRERCASILHMLPVNYDIIQTWIRRYQLNVLYNEATALNIISLHPTERRMPQDKQLTDEFEKAKKSLVKYNYRYAKQDVLAESPVLIYKQKESPVLRPLSDMAIRPKESPVLRPLSDMAIRPKESPVLRPLTETTKQKESPVLHPLAETPVRQKESPVLHPLAETPVRQKESPVLHPLVETPVRQKESPVLRPLTESPHLQSRKDIELPYINLGETKSNKSSQPSPVVSRNTSPSKQIPYSSHPSPVVSRNTSPSKQIPYSNKPPIKPNSNHSILPPKPVKIEVPRVASFVLLQNKPHKKSWAEIEEEEDDDIFKTPLK